MNSINTLTMNHCSELEHSLRGANALKLTTMEWKVDPAHSEVQFKVRHLMITNVTGYFRKFDLDVETETEDFSTVKKVRFTADVNSIDTNNGDRDKHLKSGDFFDTEKFPQIEFVSTQIKVDGDKAKLEGELTIRGITKTHTLDVELGGIADDPYGNHKAGFTVTGKISRKDFGLTWQAVTDAGKVVVGDEIKIYCDIQLVLQSKVANPSEAAAAKETRAL